MNYKEWELKRLTMNKALNYEGQVRFGKIEGVEVIPLTTNIDDRGYLTESLRSSWVGNTPIKQVYFIENHENNTVRGFHKHDVLIDWFTVMKGAALFCLFDDRPDSPTYGTLQKVVCGLQNKRSLVVPCGVHHGWKSLSEGTILLSQASEEYCKDKPDEYRIKWDSFGKDVWEKNII